MARAAVADPGDPAAARFADLVRQGTLAAKNKRWDACVTPLSEAAKEKPLPAQALGALGLCEEQTSRFALAYRHLWHALESAPADKRTEPWRQYQAGIVRLRERVVLLVLTVDPSDAAVLIDGVPVGKGDGQTIAVEPGVHTVAAKLAGYEDKVVKTEDNRAGAVPNIQLTLKPIRLDPAVSAPPPPKAPPVADPSLSRWLTPAWSPRGVLVALAYAGMAATIVSGATAIGLEVHRASLQAALDQKGYQPTTCRYGLAPSTPEECADIRARYNDRDTSSNVFLGTAITVAALSGAAGVAMYLDHRASRPSVAVTAGAAGGGIVFAGKW